MRWCRGAVSLLVPNAPEVVAQVGVEIWRDVGERAGLGDERALSLRLGGGVGFDRLDADAEPLVRLQGQWLVGDDDLAVEVGVQGDHCKLIIADGIPYGLASWALFSASK